MNASNRFWMVIVFFVLLFALGGCKAASTETVVAEKEVICQIVDVKEIEPVTTVVNPEPGNVTRGQVIKFTISCEEPYYKGTVVAIQDWFPQDDGTYFYTSFGELITEEGGVWKGSCDNKTEGSDIHNTCTFLGEGKYEGLRLTHDWYVVTGDLKYRVTRMPEE